MKYKLIKSFIFSLSIIGLIGSVGYSVQALAITNLKETIPLHMRPGSLIKYDKNDKIVIIEGGYDNTSNSKELSDKNVYTPVPQIGMTVSYDGVGYPNIIKDINGNSLADINIQHNAITKASISPSIALGSYKATGKFSWFTDSKGQKDHTLQTYDCATKQYVDDCPCGTTIAATDDTNGSTLNLKKWDVGSLPKAILDVRQPVFLMFGHPLSQGLFNGTYSHN